MNTQSESETQEALLSLIRYGYNEAIEELLEWNKNLPGLSEKLVEMQNTKKPLNYERLKQELNIL